MTAAQTPGGGEVSYSYRSSLIGPPREYILEPDAIAWRARGVSGRIPYARVRRVRMAYRPVSMQSQRFVTEIWAEGAPRLLISSTSMKGMMEQERFDAPYRAFIVELHRRLAAAGSTARFVQGLNALIYWPGVVLFVVAGFGLAGLIVRALQAQMWIGALFVTAFLALFLWQAGNYFGRNRPRPYRPEAPPAGVIPKA